jgi:hypothetical protein
MLSNWDLSRPASVRLTDDLETLPVVEKNAKCKMRIEKCKMSGCMGAEKPVSSRGRSRISTVVESHFAFCIFTFSISGDSDRKQDAYATLYHRACGGVLLRKGDTLACHD